MRAAAAAVAEWRTHTQLAVACGRWRDACERAARGGVAWDAAEAAGDRAAARRALRRWYARPWWPAQNRLALDFVGLPLWRGWWALRR